MEYLDKPGFRLIFGFEGVVCQGQDRLGSVAPRVVLNTTTLAIQDLGWVG